MAEFVSIRKTKEFARLPLEGAVDLTERCNNNCRHCWISIRPEAAEKAGELSFAEIRRIADEARQMGCRAWSISGGEPMLRADFPEIFDYLTRKSAVYTLNTNGTLITPSLCRLLKRPGGKLVALYGATADVHDRITRNPGSFAAAMQGMSYLKEAGAVFTVQLIPMRANFRQMPEMVRKAESLSPYWRIGAAWLYLSANRSQERNREIIAQRLSPRQVLELDPPDLGYEEIQAGNGCCRNFAGDDRLFAGCIAERREFHINPYGGLSFCGLVRDPALRYNLREGTFREGWDVFLPALADMVRANQSYRKNCGCCEMRSDCRWCPVYGWLEHGDFSSRVEYLCSVTAETRRFKEKWRKEHRRYFRIAGLTVRVDSDIAFTKESFDPKFESFRTDGPGTGADDIVIQHHYALPKLAGKQLGEEIYRKPPWVIYRKGNAWIYLGTYPPPEDRKFYRAAVFNHDHTRVKIYHEPQIGQTGLHSLTRFPTDQILLARVLAERQGCFFHSSAVILDKAGFLFVGHSEAGKSTMVKMLKKHAQILCDERNIVRRQPDGFHVYGTWSHGEIPDVSNGSAKLKGIMFLEKDRENRLAPLVEKPEIVRKLLACLIKPLITADWWEKTLAIIEKIADEVPCYNLHFDQSGEVVKLLRRIK